PKSTRGLGCRDLRHFNLVLLARQRWKIVSEPDSLWAKILKGKYFHDTNFFLGEEGSRPS
ncbi:hypothetical protein LINPERPRIM_LOCUS25697, partial [Linum perenne]